MLVRDAELPDAQDGGQMKGAVVGDDEYEREHEPVNQGRCRCCLLACVCVYSCA